MRRLPLPYRHAIELQHLRELVANCLECGCLKLDRCVLLAGGLKDLERHSVVRRRRLPAPAASTVYELTEYGQELRPVMHVLAHWAARSLGPPRRDEDLEPGWLAGALRMAFPPHATDERIEFRVDDEVASLVEGEARQGRAENPDAVVEGDRAAFFHLVVDREVDGVTVRGSRTVLRSVLATLPPPLAPDPAPAALQS